MANWLAQRNARASKQSQEGRDEMHGNDCLYCSNEKRERQTKEGGSSKRTKNGCDAH
jgi:hypothetical protein